MAVIFFLKILLRQANHPILARLDTFLKLMKLAKKGGGNALGEKQICFSIICTGFVPKELA